VAGQEGCGEAKAAARRHFCFFSFFLLFSGSKMRLHYLFVRHFCFLNYRLDKIELVGADACVTWLLAHLSFAEDRSGAVRGLHLSSASSENYKQKCTCDCRSTVDEFISTKRVYVIFMLYLLTNSFSVNNFRLIFK
jgi:hypothetical protein